MKSLKCFSELSARLCILLLAFFPLVAQSSVETGIVKVNSRLIEGASSFGALISIAAFILGAVGLFKAISTLMNHAENPRENPMKNVLFFALASGCGFGYTYLSTTAIETVLGESENPDIASDIFKTN